MAGAASVAFATATIVMLTGVSASAPAAAEEGATTTYIVETATPLTSATLDAVGVAPPLPTRC